MSISASFDQLLLGGRVICPASGIDGAMDVAVKGGRIAAVQPSILPTSAKEVIDVTGKLVLPGLIDTHAHVYQYVTGRFGMNADMVGVQSGVTTLVDQGGPSCMTLPGFRHFVAEPAKSRVYAFLSTYLVGGLEGHYYPQLYSPDCVDIEATVKAAIANRDLVRGIKAHAEIGGFARWGIRVIEMAAEIGRRSELPVYVHFGQLWGLPESGTNGEDVDTILTRVIPLLRSGDVLAHPFARQAKFSLVQAMSSMMALGLTLEQVVPMVTSHPAEMLGLSDTIGALKPGMDADVSVLTQRPGRYILRDNEKTEVVADHLLQ